MRAFNGLTVYSEKAILAGIFTEKSHDDDDTLAMEELQRLAETAGARILTSIVQNRHKPDSATLFGKGKVEELNALAQSIDADVVIFNNNLTPAQVRNLEEALKLKVIDRSELILDIFATHAQTKQSKLQVELAQLEYTLPRLTHMWTHLSKIEGGIGIGQRGPGEKQLEMDRRIARDKIVKLRNEINEIQAHKVREVTARSENYTISLIGYTNAGKSTLMKRLTGADVLVQDKLFSTLDTKTHTWQFSSGQKVLLSDTVGFIRNLPHNLVASFHATLEEVSQADILLHVVDVSAQNAEMQIDAVNAVLKELHCQDKSILLVFNKIDLADDHLHLSMLRTKYPDAISISALSGTGMDELEKTVSSHMHGKQNEIELIVPVQNGKLLAYLSEKGRILSKELKGTKFYVRVMLGNRDAVIVKKMNNAK